MSVLYRPVLIESAEQAEALPIGTVAVSLTSEGVVDQAAVRVRGGWDVTAEGVAGVPFLSITAWGMTALVPIEAEVRTVDASTFAYPDRHVTRYVTSWEEA